MWELASEASMIFLISGVFLTLLCAPRAGRRPLYAVVVESKLATWIALAEVSTEPRNDTRVDEKPLVGVTLSASVRSCCSKDFVCAAERFHCAWLEGTPNPHGYQDTLRVIFTVNVAGVLEI